MDFFKEIDSIDIVEAHAQKVLKLEEKQAKGLLQRYKEIRVELRDRLDRWPEDTFTAQQLRGVLIQVDAAINAMTKGLKDSMAEIAPDMALVGVEDQLSEIQRFEKHFRGAVVPINLNAQLIAQDTSNFLINRYEASLNAYGESLRSQITLNLTNESLMQSSLSSVVRRLGQFFMGEEWKLQRIARTEFHNLYGMGKTNGMLEVRDNYLPDLKKTIYHPMDSRTADDSKFSDSLKLIAEIDEPFKYKWKGKERVFYTVDRPMDRQIIVPYRKAWDD